MSRGVIRINTSFIEKYSNSYYANGHSTGVEVGKKIGPTLITKSRSNSVTLSGNGSLSVSFNTGDFPNKMIGVTYIAISEDNNHYYRATSISISGYTVTANFNPPGYTSTFNLYVTAIGY